MKKNYLLALSFTCAVGAFNTVSAKQAGGFYAGLSAGGSLLAGKANTVLGTQIGHGGEYYSAQNNLSNFTGAAGIFAGYGMNCSDFWLAGELFYQYDQLKNKNQWQAMNNTGYKTLTAKSTGAWGGAVHLGFTPNKNCALYAIIGLEMRRFKVRLTDNDIPVDIHTSINKSYASIAFAPGIGTRINLANNWAVRFEYKYAMHRNKTFNASAADPAGGTDTINIKYKPVTHSFMMGAVYNF